jgi:hypothetical protein
MKKNVAIFSMVLLAVVSLSLYLDGSSAGVGGLSVWDVAKSIRPGAGGGEAEYATWTWTSRTLQQTVTRGRREWKVTASGDARPVMRRLTIESLDGTVDAPFLLSDKNYDFRSIPELVASVTRNAKTDEEKALALRELLIGEGFFFHHSVPVAVDPIQRLTNSGYGYCGVHAQIYDQLAVAAGLRVRTCSHSFGYGHGTNEVFYDGQWHFIDSNAEALFRRPDGVIPAYDNMRRDPALVPPGDAYGQTSYGIDGARYARALYTSPTNCVERAVSADTKSGTLDFPLRKGESIIWEWRDSDFTRNRVNDRPSYGAGQMQYRPSSVDLARLGSGVRVISGQLRPVSASGPARLQIPVHSAYPVMEAQAKARIYGAADGVAARISKDGGKTWSALAARQKDGLTVWSAVIDDPDRCAFAPDRAKLTSTARTVVAAEYGYLFEISMTPAGGRSPALSDFQLTSVFRHYPPALPYLEVGDNLITYVDRGAIKRRVRVTLDWEERRRSHELSTDAADWGWRPAEAMTAEEANGALPVLAEGPSGALHLVYSVGAKGVRRVAYRRYTGGSWSEARLVTGGDHDANHPVVAEGGDETVWIAYQTGDLWKGGDVFVVTVKGATVSAPVRLNTNDPYHIAFFPSISAQGRKIAVAWEGGEPGADLNNAWGTEIGWLCVFDGTSWEEPSPIRGEPFKNLGLPKISYDRRGRLHLTATKGPRYYRTFPPAEAKGQYRWLTPEWMYHSRGGAIYPDRAGNIWAVFDGQNSGTTNEIYLRMLPVGATGTDIAQWTQALRVSEDDKRPSIYPNMVAEDASLVTTVWMDYRRERAEIYSKIFHRGRWSPDLLISRRSDEQIRRAGERMTPNQILWAEPRGAQSTYPHIARAGDGAVWAVWQESPDARHSRIIARRLTYSR